MLVCSTCGDTNIQHKCWVEINTKKVLDPCPEDADLVWCDTCEDHVSVKDTEWPNYP